jgi:hypothetical protein
MVADCTELRFVTASVRRAARLQHVYADAFLEDARGGGVLIGEQFAELCDRICELVGDYKRQYKALYGGKYVGSTGPQVSHLARERAELEALARTAKLFAAP